MVVVVLERGTTHLGVSLLHQLHHLCPYPWDTLYSYCGPACYRYCVVTVAQPVAGHNSIIAAGQHQQGVPPLIINLGIIDCTQGKF